MSRLSYQNSGRMESIRKAGNRGKFYPASAGEIRRMIDYWNSLTGDRPKVVPQTAVCPHAGYVYSGYTANSAHRLIPEAKPGRVLVIGPSHHVYIEGMSLGVFDAYETPFGLVPGDAALTDWLSDKFVFDFSARAHYLEHSTETQFPFLAYYNPGIKIVELIYGNVSPEVLSQVISHAKSLPGTAVVVSTDLSHYYDQRTANRLDKHCIEAVLQKNTAFLSQCEACGKSGLDAVIRVAQAEGWQPLLTDYRTSGDVTGEFDAVVGYLGAVFY